MKNSIPHLKTIQKLNGNVEKDAIRGGRKGKESLVI